MNRFLYCVERKKVKVSVVTIVKDDANNIEKTIQSVLSQSNVPFEYLIKDGLSKDGTLKIIKKYSNVDNRIRFFSESDLGIYDAMNISVKLATGDYVWFMNSGDTFYDQNTLNFIYNLIKTDNFDLVYGDVVVQKFKHEKLFKSSDFKFLPTKLPFCHQSSIVKKTLLKSYPFNLNYKYSSDYDFFCNISKRVSCLSIKKIDNRTLSFVSEGGASDKNRVKTSLEYIKISKNHFGKIRINLIFRFLKVILSVIYYEHFKRIS